MVIQGLSLKIDTKCEAESIEENIRKLLEANSAGGIVMGLSGGIDSAVLAALTVRAVGTERLLAYNLYDKDSSKQLRAKAQLVADWLGIHLELQDITPEMRKTKIYSPLIMKIINLSGFINRCLYAKPIRSVCPQSPFISALSREDFSGNKIKRFVYKNTIGSIEAAFNARHRYRRKFLEQKAKEKNWIVLGAANRTELMVGWFVKGGVDDLPFSPIIGLYKTQVLQLAEYLGVPFEIRNQAPSPDMAKGITDESALGISYGELDVILDCMERGMLDQEIVSKGIGPQKLLLVHTMKNLSEWKRMPENVDLPAA